MPQLGKRQRPEEEMQSEDEEAEEAAVASQVQEHTEDNRQAIASDCIVDETDNSQTPVSSTQCLVQEQPASKLQSLQQQRLQAVWQQVQRRMQQEDSRKQQQQDNKAAGAEPKQKQKQQARGSSAAVHSSSSSSSSSSSCGGAWPPLHAACFDGVVSNNADVASNDYQLPFFIPELLGKHMCFCMLPAYVLLYACRRYP
jgi:hypothetical protein